MPQGYSVRQSLAPTAEASGSTLSAIRIGSEGTGGGMALRGVPVRQSLLREETMRARKPIAPCMRLHCVRRKP